MNCFQLIKSVLDELYPNIPGADESAKDSLIYGCILYLYDRYKNLLLQHEPIDYHNIVTRFAYIYKYVPFHANIIFNVINRSPELQSIFNNQNVKITCIGGGPGSDFLGLLKYVMGTQKRPSINFTLFDREELWGESWEDVGDKIGPDFKIYANFQRFDVTDSETWAHKEKYLNSNLFTMMYFMSEVYSIRNAASAFFENLFAKIPRGAYVLFVDNNTDEFINWFDELAFKNNVIPLQKQRTYMRLEDQGEQKNDLGIYYKKFCEIDNCRPKLTAQIVFRVCQKN